MREAETRSRPFAKTLRRQMTHAEVRIIIEVDGASHDTTDGMRHDDKRTAYLTEAGWRLLRFSNNDIYKNLDGVWAGVNHALHIERGEKREG